MNKVVAKNVSELVDILNNIRVPLSSKQRETLAKIYPYYGAQGIVDYIDNYLFDGEYILIAEDGENLKSNNQNICNLVQGKFWVNNHAHIVRANANNSTKYLYYNFNRIKFEPYVTGSSQPKLNKENLLNIKAYVHENLNYQKSIAKVLSDLDSKIELNNRINLELEAIAKTLYDYWFVQFDFPNEQGKPYKSSGGKMVYNAELKREIPEGWDVKNIFKCCNVQYGFPFSTDYFNTVGKGVPVVRIRDILNNSISNYSFEQNIDPKYLIKKGDILVGMDGNFHINYWAKDGCYLNQRAVKLSETILPNIYLKYQIEPFIKLREKSVSRTTVGHLSDKDLKALSIIIPSKAVLSTIFSIYNNLIKRMIQSKSENQQLSSLRDWLLPMLMNGQVTVKEAEEKMSMAAEPSVKYGE